MKKLIKASNNIDTDSVPKEKNGMGDEYPARCVSFYEALVYCNKRSIAEGLTPCYKIRRKLNEFLLFC